MHQKWKFIICIRSQICPSLKFHCTYKVKECKKIPIKVVCPPMLSIMTSESMKNVFNTGCKNRFGCLYFYK